MNKQLADLSDQTLNRLLSVVVDETRESIRGKTLPTTRLMVFSPGGNAFNLMGEIDNLLGSLVRKPKKPDNNVYRIWSLDGAVFTEEGMSEAELMDRMYEAGEYMYKTTHLFPVVAFMVGEATIEKPNSKRCGIGIAGRALDRRSLAAVQYIEQDGDDGDYHPGETEYLMAGQIQSDASVLDAFFLGVSTQIARELTAPTGN